MADTFDKFRILEYKRQNYFVPLVDFSIIFLGCISGWNFYRQPLREVSIFKYTTGKHTSSHNVVVDPCLGR